MKLLFVALVMVIGCSSGNSTKTPDAPAQKMDAPAGATCTGLTYDSCNAANSNCMNGDMCKNYPMPSPGFTVCVPTCSASMPCPMQGSVAATCNNMGICKPVAANTDCTAPQ
jgi:hypothetical protein